MICFASVGCSSSQSPSLSFVAFSTIERISVLPSLVLVWPSNCGLRSFTETIAVRPSRMSSPRRLSSFSLSRPLAAAVLVHRVGEGLLEALLVHAALGGGDVVRERVDALVVAGVPLHRDLDLGGRSTAPRTTTTRLKIGSFDALRCFTKSTMPPVNRKVCSSDRVGALVLEADLETLVEERHLAQPLEQRLGAELGLLEDRRVGPERDDGAASASTSGLLHDACPGACRRSRSAISHLPPSRWISSSSRLESAFTTETPTPCRPPEIL